MPDFSSLMGVIIESAMKFLVTLNYATLGTGRDGHEVLVQIMKPRLQVTFSEDLDFSALGRLQLNLRFSI